MLTRREALSAMALVSGAAVVPAACKNLATDVVPSNFKYSLNTSTISGQTKDIIEYVDITAKAGYDYIEVWVRDIQSFIDDGNSTSELKRYIEEKGLRIASAIGFAPWMTGGEEGFVQMEKEMLMLAEIGCPRIAAPPAGVDASRKLDLLETGRIFANLIELGRKTGVMPQLEFWGASKTLWHMGQVLMIAAAADDAEVKILPDVYHLFRGGSGFESLKMLNGSLIDIFHLNDYPGSIPRLEQNDAGRVYPGDGVAPLKSILSDLNNMGGEKILSLELFNREYWKEDALSVAKKGLSKMKTLVGLVR